MPITHLGRYEIIGDLGRGAMGMVLKARDPLIDRSVAIKTLVCHGLTGDPAEALERRFFAEAKCAGRLNHPNVVTIYDVGREGNVAYIAMEFIEGRSLREVLDSGVVLGADRVADIAAQLADGLAFAHANDIVHCDIKPSNVMVLDSGGVKIADFGVAMLPSGPQIEDGTAIGSPKYMSPEQATGQRLDGRSDIFALGAVVYEMLTGMPPFTGDNLAAVLQQVIHSDPVAPSRRRQRLHPGFDAIVAKALAKDPDRRYRTAAEMALDLRRFQDMAAKSQQALESIPNVAPASIPQAHAWSRPAARPRQWLMNRAAAGTAMVLTAIVAVRLLQPAAVQAPSAASTSAQQIASTATGEAKARAADGKPVRARTAARVSRDERTHRARTGAKHIEASGLVRTNSAASDRPVDFAAPRQHASEGGHAVTAQASPVAEAPVTAKAASPAQICADRSNFISRGFCENQVCLKAEWKDQPYCVKKREQDLRLNPVLAISN